MKEKKPRQERFEKEFLEYLGKEIYGEQWTMETHKQIYEEGELEKRLLSGYWYRLGGSTTNSSSKRRPVLAQTGMGGAKEYIQACKRQGIMNEDLIAGGIEVFVEGEWVKMTDPRLHHVKLKKDDEANTTEENWVPKTQE